jgi:hypothetical protein
MLIPFSQKHNQIYHHFAMDIRMDHCLPAKQNHLDKLHRMQMFLLLVVLQAHMALQ